MIITNWNIRHGGGKRTREIIDVIKDNKRSDIFILTEFRNNSNKDVFEERTPYSRVAEAAEIPALRERREAIVHHLLHCILNKAIVVGTLFQKIHAHTARYQGCTIGGSIRGGAMRVEGPNRGLEVVRLRQHAL